MLRFSGPTPHRYSAIKENTNGIAKATYCYNRQSRKTLKIQTDASPSMHRPMFTVFLVCQIDRQASPPVPSISRTRTRTLSRTRSNKRAHVRRRKISPCSRVLRTRIKAHWLKLPLMRKVSRRRCRGEHVELGNIGRLHMGGRR